MKIASRIRNWQRRLLDQAVRANPGLGLDRRAEDFVALFENHFLPASRILDIGGGWGFYDEPLRRRGHHVTVLDVVKPGFQKSPVIVYDGTRMPFADKSFDASLLITALHHIKNPEAVVREARRVTRRTLVVVEDLYRHALGRWWTDLRDRLYNFEYFGHPSQFKKKDEWIEWFRSLGFNLVEEKEITTTLAGLRILNGVMIYEIARD